MESMVALQSSFRFERLCLCCPVATPASRAQTGKLETTRNLLSLRRLPRDSTALPATLSIPASGL